MPAISRDVHGLSVHDILFRLLVVKPMSILGSTVNPSALFSACGDHPLHFLSVIEFCWVKHRKLSV